MVVSNFKDGRICLRNVGVKGLNLNKLLLCLENCSSADSADSNQVQSDLGLHKYLG